MLFSAAAMSLMEDSSDSSNSDLDEPLDGDMEEIVVLIAAKELTDRRRKRRHGSTVGRLCIPRNRKLGNDLLMRDYFVEVSIYPPHLFRHRYRMRRELFNKIVRTCESNTLYFKQKRNCVGLLGFSAHQKISAVMRVLAYAIPADYTDELRIGEDTTTESVRRLPGYLNDINVLHRSHLLARLASGDAPACNYTVNGHDYTMGYYLADGIYPEWSTCVKTIRNPASRAESEFAKAQKAARKDIERAFGVLQARFAVVRGLSRFWDKDTLRDIMTTCVIMHNMIIEDEKDLDLEFFFDNVGTRVKPARNPDHIQAFLETYRDIENTGSHKQLQLDLIQHHWMRHGGH
ncbi:uncharacterized protein [Lolium perenne]|uniref:uncharacterized protein n=1 Tax=Lolium perenne TaxID=4522 RepID=UPI003A9A5CAD